MSAFAKGNAQSGRKYDHKGVFNKHIDEILSSAKGYLPISADYPFPVVITRWVPMSDLAGLDTRPLSVVSCPLHKTRLLKPALQKVNKGYLSSISKWQAKRE